MHNRQRPGHSRSRYSTLTITLRLLEAQFTELQQKIIDTRVQLALTDLEDLNDQDITTSSTNNNEDSSIESADNNNNTTDDETAASTTASSVITTGNPLLDFDVDIGTRVTVVNPNNDQDTEGIVIGATTKFLKLRTPNGRTIRRHPKNLAYYEDE